MGEEVAGIKKPFDRRESEIEKMSKSQDKVGAGAKMQSR